MARTRLEEYRRALHMQYQMAAEKGLPPPQPPHLRTRSSQAPAALPHLTISALQASSHDEAQTSRVVPAGGSAPVWGSGPPDARPVPDVESFLSHSRHQTTDGSAVTERHRHGLNPLSVTDELAFRSPDPPGAIRAVCPSVADGAVQAPVQSGALPQDSVRTSPAGPTEDPILRQTEEQQAVASLRRRHAWEMEHVRRQKQCLQALIHLGAQVSGANDRFPRKRPQMDGWICYLLLPDGATGRSHTGRGRVGPYWSVSSQFTRVFDKSD